MLKFLWPRISRIHIATVIASGFASRLFYGLWHGLLRTEFSLSVMLQFTRLQPNSMTVVSQRIKWRLAQFTSLQIHVQSLSGAYNVHFCYFNIILCHLHVSTYCFWPLTFHVSLSFLLLTWNSPAGLFLEFPIYTQRCRKHLSINWFFWFYNIVKEFVLQSRITKVRIFIVLATYCIYWALKYMVENYKYLNYDIIYTLLLYKE